MMEPQNVNHVPSSVILVWEMLITVLIVLKTESKNHLVNVTLLLVTSTLHHKLNVQNVPFGVLLVLLMTYVNPVT